MSGTGDDDTCSVGAPEVGRLQEVEAAKAEEEDTGGGTTATAVGSGEESVSSGIAEDNGQGKEKEKENELKEEGDEEESDEEESDEEEFDEEESDEDEDEEDFLEYSLGEHQGYGGGPLEPASSCSSFFSSAFSSLSSSSSSSSSTLSSSPRELQELLRMAGLGQGKEARVGDVLAVVERLFAKIQKQEKDLALASEMGQQLVQQNEALSNEQERYRLSEERSAQELEKLRKGLKRKVLRKKD